jgi:hypothetical protein
MLPAAVRRRVAVLRQPGPAVRLARALWVAWAVIVWNVVFDRVMVVAGRDYVAAAYRAAAEPSARPPSMDDWMQPAAARGVWLASAAAAAIVLVGFASIRFAAREAGRPTAAHGGGGTP